MGHTNYCQHPLNIVVSNMTIFSHNLVYTGIRFIQDSVKTRFHSSSRKDVIANHDQGGHHGFLSPMQIVIKQLKQ
jgi:hypothetical protein